MSNRAVSFIIEAADERDFERQGRRIERSLEEIDSAGLGGPGTKSVQSVVDEITTAATRGSFAAHFIEVIERDGMSWSSEVVQRALRAKLPHYNFWCLSDRTRSGPLPAAADWLGTTPFLRLAVRSGVTNSFFTLRAFVAPLVFCLAGASGLAAALQNAAVRQIEPSLSAILARPWFYVVSASVYGALQLLTLLLTAYTKRSESDSIKNFESDVAAASPARVAAFVTALVKCLCESGFPRVIIIDNYARLDSTTKRVLQGYLGLRSDTAGAGSEIWLVFESNVHPDLQRYVGADIKRRAALRPRCYRQLPLKLEERRELAEAAGRGPEAADFRTVARICCDDTEGQERTLRLLQDWRSKYPREEQKYGPLDSLYLVALTASPGDLVLEQEFLARVLSAKSGATCSLVRRALRGTELKKGEIVQTLLEVRHHFGSMLESPSASELRVLPDAAVVIEREWRMLRLAEPGAIHLLWVLIWMSKRVGLDAFWHRKLAHHLLHCDHALSIELEGNLANLDTLHEVCIAVALGCLKTCLLSPVPDLLRVAAAIYETTPWPAAEQRRFARAAFEAYNVLGDESVLVLLLERIARDPSLREAGSAPNDGLELLFLDTLPIGADRDRLAVYLTRRNARYADIGSVLADYGSARAAWLTLILLGFAERIPSLRCAGLVPLARTRTRELVARLLDELARTPDEAAGVPSLLAISTGLWTLALGCDPSAHQGLSAASASWVGGAGQTAALSSLMQAVHDLLEAAQQSVRVSRELRAVANLERQVGSDLLLAGLAQELCVVALAALVLADRLTPKLFSAEIAKCFKQLAGEVNHGLGYQIPETEFSGTAVVQRLSELMAFCVLVWRRFGLDSLADSMNLRRVQFRAVCSSATERGRDALLRQVEAIGMTAEEKSFTGLMANLTLAKVYQASWELAAQYLNSATEIAIEAKLGQPLRCDLALASLNAGAVSASRASVFFEQLLAGDDDRATALYDYLIRLEQAHLPRLVGRLVRISSAERDERYQRLIRIIELAAQSSPQHVADIVRDLVALDLLRRRAADGAAPSPDILKPWEANPTGGAYAAALEMLLASRAPVAVRDALKAQALKLIERDPAENVWRWNSYLHLAVTLGQELSASSDPAVGNVARYLKGAVTEFSPTETAESNMRAYQVLHKLDPGNADDYVEEVKKYQIVAMDRDHMLRLPALAREGKFFLVFYEYYLTWTFWGLIADESSEQLHAALRADLDSRQVALNRWQDVYAGRVPDPLRKLGETWAVSAEFLTLGSHLFTPPLDQEAALRDARGLFDQAARAWFPRLIQTIVRLPMLPAAFAELVRSFGQRFHDIERASDSSIPPEPQSGDAVASVGG